jgi:hypothetical protein
VRQKLPLVNYIIVAVDVGILYACKHVMMACWVFIFPCFAPDFTFAKFAFPCTSSKAAYSSSQLSKIATICPILYDPLLDTNNFSNLLP